MADRDAPRRKRERSGRTRLAEVAALADVSTATVSRVFNRPDIVSEDVRTRVRAAAEALNWIPDAAGRALASSRTHIVGAVIPTLDTEIFARQVSGMQGVLAQRGFTLFLGCTNYDPAESLAQVKAMLGRGVEALALVGENHPSEVFDALRAHQVPYVLTYTHRADIPHPCIGFDHCEAFKEIAEHVLSLGHRRVGVILQPLAHNDRVRHRLQGVRDALQARGMGLAPQDLHVGPSTLAFGAEAFGVLMRGNTPPTAVICGNDTLALGALDAATRLGIAVPERCSITGFDDLAISSLSKPPLTTMWVDNVEIGRRAATHLLAMMDGTPSLPPPLRPHLRIRATTARAAP